MQPGSELISATGPQLLYEATAWQPVGPVQRVIRRPQVVQEPDHRLDGVAQGCGARRRAGQLTAAVVQAREVPGAQLQRRGVCGGPEALCEPAGEGASAAGGRVGRLEGGRRNIVLQSSAERQACAGGLWHPLQALC